MQVVASTLNVVGTPHQLEVLTVISILEVDA